MTTSRTQGRFRDGPKQKTYIQPNIVSTPQQLNTIVQSDWILMKYFSGVCQVQSFCVLNAKNDSEAKVPLNHIDINTKTITNVGVSLTYYVLHSNGTLTLADTSKITESEHFPLECYKSHVPTPNKNDRIWSYTREIVSLISQHIALSPVKCFAPRFGKNSSIPKKGTDAEYLPNNSKVAPKRNEEKNSRKRRLTVTSSQKDDDIDTEWSLEMAALSNIQSRKRSNT